MLDTSSYQSAGAGRMAPRFIAKQLSMPSGIGGWFIRAGMNRGNARLNHYAFDQLDLIPEDRLIEVGFGGAVMIPRLLDHASFVCGIDRSQDVVEVAARRFAGAIRAGRAEFRVGSIEQLPLPDAAFTKALSVHTMYFWRSLEAGSAELSRILVPGARVVLGFLPKAHMDRIKMPPDIFTPREPEAVLDALNEAGFTDTELRKPTPKSKWVVATGVRR